MAVIFGEKPGGDSSSEETPTPPVVVIEPPQEMTEEPTPSPADNQLKKVYTVRRGDYLTVIARKFGVNWRVLAEVNHLSPPYILYTGQKLKIP